MYFIRDNIHIFKQYIYVMNLRLLTFLTLALLLLSSCSSKQSLRYKITTVSNAKNPSIADTIFLSITPAVQQQAISSLGRRCAKSRRSCTPGTRVSPVGPVAVAPEPPRPVLWRYAHRGQWPTNAKAPSTLTRRSRASQRISS